MIILKSLFFGSVVQQLRLLWGGCFVEITIITQNFHASVGKFQFSRFCFSGRNFQRFIFNYFTFRFINSAKKNSSFSFQLSVGGFQLSSFCFSSFYFSHFSFSSVNCQIPTFRLLPVIPIFTLLLCKFLRKQMFIF